MVIVPKQNKTKKKTYIVERPPGHVTFMCTIGSTISQRKAKVREKSDKIDFSSLGRNHPISHSQMDVWYPEF
jgi:hypothetical protein